MTLDLQRFLGAAVASASHAAEVLGVGALVVAERAVIARDESGAALALWSDQGGFDLALFSGDRGFKLIALALLESDQGPREELEDAFGEFVNMLAGGMKHSLFGLVPNLRLGLPRVLAPGTLKLFSCSIDLLMGESRFTLALRPNPEHPPR